MVDDILKHATDNCGRIAVYILCVILWKNDNNILGKITDIWKVVLFDPFTVSCMFWFINDATN